MVLCGNMYSACNPHFHQCLNWSMTHFSLRTVHLVVKIKIHCTIMLTCFRSRSNSTKGHVTVEFVWRQVISLFTSTFVIMGLISKCQDRHVRFYAFGLEVTPIMVPEDANTGTVHVMRTSFTVGSFWFSVLTHHSPETWRWGISCMT